VQELKPLAVEHIGLAAGNTADLTGIGQQNFKSTVVKDLE